MSRVLKRFSSLYRWPDYSFGKEFWVHCQSWRMWFLCCMYEVTETHFLSLLSFRALEVLRPHFQVDFHFILKSGAQGEMIWF